MHIAQYFTGVKMGGGQGGGEAIKSAAPPPSSRAHPIQMLLSSAVTFEMGLGTLLPLPQGYFMAGGS